MIAGQGFQDFSDPVVVKVDLLRQVHRGTDTPSAAPWARGTSTLSWLAGTPSEQG